MRETLRGTLWSQSMTEGSPLNFPPHWVQLIHTASGTEAEWASICILERSNQWFPPFQTSKNLRAHSDWEISDWRYLPVMETAVISGFALGCRVNLCRAFVRLWHVNLSGWLTLQCWPETRQYKTVCRINHSTKEMHPWFAVNCEARVDEANIFCWPFSLA